MATPPWEELEHTADVALRVYGPTLADFFANAARGMLNLAWGSGAAPAGAQNRVPVSLQAPDLETLLVDWLTELVYLMEDEAFIASDVTVFTVEENALRAEVAGGPGGELQRHIKAVTYHNLLIEQTEAGYQATIVFDV